jgi:glycerol-3-phosphate acyltransferase PlsY
MEDIVAVAFGYLAGSVPFAFLLARRRGIDLRRTGSGNVGATNVLRTSGVSNAVAAMCLDALKGALAVVIAQQLAAGPATSVAAGLASIIGHVYPVWLRFHGGKGVATAAGVFGVLTPAAVGAAAALFVASVATTRYISVGSMAAAVALPIVAAATGAAAPVVAGAAISAAVVVHRHRGNLVRLIAGTERRVGQRS